MRATAQPAPDTADGTRSGAEREPPLMPFPFIGGVLAIDLVNSEVMVRGKYYDLLRYPEDVVAWWHGAVQQHPADAEVQYAGALPPPDSVLLQATRTLRGALRTMLHAVVAKQTIASAETELLNAALHRGDLEGVPRAEGGLRQVYHVPPTLENVILFPVARSALWLFSEGTLSRIQHCQNAKCTQFFYDETRSATRHWCSIACADRARSSARYQQRREAR